MLYRMSGKTFITSALALAAALLVQQAVPTKAAPVKSDGTPLIETMKTAPAQYDCGTTDWYKEPSHWMVD
jgi:hypothetical protein